MTRSIKAACTIEADSQHITDLAAGRGLGEQSDVWGLVVMPVYDFTERWQLVLRYSYMDSDEVNGTIELLSPDLTETFATIELRNVGIFSLHADEFGGSSFEVELYAEGMTFSF